VVGYRFARAEEKQSRQVKEAKEGSRGFISSRELKEGSEVGKYFIRSNEVKEESEA